MLGAYVKSRYNVTPRILSEAVKEVQGGSHQQRLFSNGTIVLTSMLIGALVLAVLVYNNSEDASKLFTQQSEAALPEQEITALEEPAIEPAAPVVMVEEAPAIAEQQDEGSELPNWPDNITSTPDTFASAHARLFSQWNKTMDEDITDHCAQAMNWGLRCYSGIGNLGSLANNDRPAILTLLDNEGRQYQATLLMLEDELATVAFAHGIETVSLQDLEARWQGQYKMLWRMNPQGLSIFRPGEAGSGITWLTKSLIAAGIGSLASRALTNGLAAVGPPATAIAVA